jgi:hypothetical protein
MKSLPFSISLTTMTSSVAAATSAKYLRRTVQKAEFVALERAIAREALVRGRAYIDVAIEI